MAEDTIADIYTRTSLLNVFVSDEVIGFYVRTFFL